MSVSTPLYKMAQVIYPERDGKPMADNMLQFRWMVMIQGGLDWLFRDVRDVLVAGDLLWYPVEGNNRISAAPDTMVVFGRPKTDRRSYLQWLEEDIPPQVTFEVQSQYNTPAVLAEKLAFYERYGVEEYYLYDPGACELSAWRRKGNRLLPVAEPVFGQTSPRLGIKFEQVDGELQILGPDGLPFSTYMALAEQHEAQRQRADRLAAQLRALGVEPEA